MKVTLHTDTLGIEIKKAIFLNCQKRAQEFNRKQAEKYLKYCESTGDKILIEYAKEKLLKEC